MTAGVDSDRRVRFRAQARSAYSRDFGARMLADEPDDDLDRRSRLSPWPTVAAVLVVGVLVAMGLGIRVPVNVVVTPVGYAAGRLIAVPADGAKPADLVGAPAELRQGDRRIPVTVASEVQWRLGNQRLAAVALRVGQDVTVGRPEQATVVVTVGERSLLADLVAGGKP